MHPILFEIPKFEIGNWIIGPLPIRMYGLMIGIGFLLAIWLAARRGKQEGINPDRILDMGVYLLPGGHHRLTPVLRARQSPRVRAGPS